MAAPSVVLQQAKPAAATPETLYTVPAGRRARLQLFVANNSGGADDAAVWVRKSGAARNDNLNLLMPFVSVGSKAKSEVIGGGAWFYVAAGDVVDVSSTSGNILFHLNGYEDDVPA